MKENGVSGPRTRTGTTRHRVVVVVGTRPEAIKMAPVILALRASADMKCTVVATAQHREMLDQALRLFRIEPDVDLNIMRPGQSLTSLTARLLNGFETVLDEYLPDAVLAQGDTTTVMAVALACFYRHIHFGHVEAGLRTGDLSSPFPEEFNRVIASKLARWHFAPTSAARLNLLSEGIAEGNIHVTGNTVIDALFSVAAQPMSLPFPMDEKNRLILITAHRRENFGEPLLNICRAVLTLLEEIPDLIVVFPVHPNPNVWETVNKTLGGTPRVLLCAPLDYRSFVAVIKASYLILTDSGGVQEEAPALGKPVLVLRRETERPEAIEAGVVKLVGTGHDAIVDAVRILCTDSAAYAAMARGISPYGDGHAAGRIVRVLESHFRSCA